MKALALFGSAALLLYVLGLLGLTFTNVSRAMFDTGEKQVGQRGFLSRQFLIFLWPLVALSREGRELFVAIWTGEDLE